MRRNTTDQFGSVAKWLHWLTALFILLAYLIIYYVLWIQDPESSLRIPLIRTHKAIGFCVIIFFVLRISWRLTNVQPRHPESMPKWQVIASSATHFLLYFLIIAMPVSGYLGNSVGVVVGPYLLVPPPDHIGFFIWWFNLLGVTYEQFEVPFDYFHYEIAGPLLFPVVLAAHVAAALYHHYVEKDEVLKRMLPNFHTEQPSIERSYTEPLEQD